MNPRIIDQGDVRWASLPYPKDPWTVKSDGCGLCAVTMCVMELSKYWNYTPKNTISFMRKYATNGDGTEWAGIDAGLDKYVGNHKRHYNLESFWAEVGKGNRIGVILFNDNIPPDGKEWTLSGHYVMFAQYKYEDGQHWLYTKDSSWRKKSGFYSYEKSMKGCISVLWTAEIPKNGWLKENGYWYFYKDGVKQTGWLKDDSKWYYLGTDGKMYLNAWTQSKGEWYWLKSNGVMAASEWLETDKGWYYLGKSGKMLHDAWLRWKNNFYYLRGSGLMATGSLDAPCKFDSKGKLETSE